MDMYPKYKSKFGYQIGNNQIDNYGVDHSGFSLQDELAYQFAREEKENKLLEQLKSRGITQDLPQYTTDFWGNPANNYGFGTTDIAANIEKMKNNPTPMPQATPTPQQKNNMLPNNPVAQQNPLQQVVGAIRDMTTEYFNMKNHGYKYLDDYHHCKANYNAASRGPLGYNTAKYLGNAKETFDFYWNQLYKGKSRAEAIADKSHDLGVNAIGRLRGDSGLYNSAQDACADYRLKNPSFPKKYW